MLLTIGVIVAAWSDQQSKVGGIAMSDWILLIRALERH